MAQMAFGLVSTFSPRGQFQHWVEQGMWFGKGRRELRSGMLMLWGRQLCSVNPSARVIE